MSKSRRKIYEESEKNESNIHTFQSKRCESNARGYDSSQL